MAVSVGLPASIFFVLPVVDATFAQGEISRFVGFMFGTVFGLNKAQPYTFYFTGLLTACLFFGLSWWVNKRAMVNN